MENTRKMPKWRSKPKIKNFKINFFVKRKFK